MRDRDTSGAVGHSLRDGDTSGALGHSLEPGGLRGQEGNAAENALGSTGGGKAAVTRRNGDRAAGPICGGSSRARLPTRLPRPSGHVPSLGGAQPSARCAGIGTRLEHSRDRLRGGWE